MTQTLGSDRDLGSELLPWSEPQSHIASQRTTVISDHRKRKTRHRPSAVAPPIDLSRPSRSPSASEAQRPQVDPISFGGTAIISFFSPRCDCD